MITKQAKIGSLIVEQYDSRNSMGKAAAAQCAAKIRQLLAEKEEINMIFAAAPSQNEFLANLIQEPDIDWNRINGFNMDEYIGLPADAPQLFRNYLMEHLFSKVTFKHFYYINSDANDYREECERFRNLLSKMPPDIVCMGVGENGHIAFNDPPVADFNDPHLIKQVELDLVCRNQQVNDGCFATIDLVPTHALTLTIPALMAGKTIFCMVPGKTKADAIYNIINGEIGTSCPASILRTHSHATLYIDAESGAKLI